MRPYSPPPDCEKFAYTSTATIASPWALTVGPSNAAVLVAPCGGGSFAAVLIADCASAS